MGLHGVVLLFLHESLGPNIHISETVATTHPLGPGGWPSSTIPKSRPVAPQNETFCGFLGGIHPVFAASRKLPKHAGLLDLIYN